MIDESNADWITDGNGNRASIAYFGSEKAARDALESLANCRQCTNCSRCSDCLRCSGCSNCSRCSNCSGCSRCSRCSDCLRCSDCSRCSNCSDCLRCSNCSRCSDCSDCLRCSNCLRCSDCSGCSHIAFLDSQQNLQGDPNKSTAWSGPPPVPVIDNIHQRVFDAVSHPNALDMESWHKCNTTHCRGGWIVNLAGEAGYALERFHNTLLAAQLIYRASGYEINPCRFYDSNEEAMADMKRLAEAEAAQGAAT